jgi:hypothetical protein
MRPTEAEMSRGIRHPRILELALRMLETARTLAAVPELLERLTEEEGDRDDGGW